MPPREGRNISIAPSTIWLIFSIVAAAAVIGYVLARASAIVVMLFIAIIFAETIHPIMNRQRRHDIPRLPTPSA